MNIDLEKEINELKVIRSLFNEGIQQIDRLNSHLNQICEILIRNCKYSEFQTILEIVFSSKNDIEKALNKLEEADRVTDKQVDLCKMLLDYQF